MRGWVFVVVAACALAGCNTTGDLASTMYPEAVRAGGAVKSDTAILLVGNGGSETINYLQFVHSGFPAINARGISLAPDGFVAIPVAVGTTGLELQNYTTTGRPGTYLPNGVSMGFVPVHTPRIDIPSLDCITWRPSSRDSNAISRRGRRPFNWRSCERSGPSSPG
ncbi:hypothetical protein [Bradyrhizobium sp. 930_D9_N1_4]|uniref:hypothetical protein n=1 Tax=Bradyrhizobium sp. 930_D9_N1_4 TaxID=3240374 RepID=UPI003F8B0CD4